MDGQMDEVGGWMDGWTERQIDGMNVWIER